MDRGVLDRLLLHVGSLSSVYGKEPGTFLKGIKVKTLGESKALDPKAKESFYDSLGLPSMARPVVAVRSDSEGYGLGASGGPPPLPPKSFSMASSMGQREEDEGVEEQEEEYIDEPQQIGSEEDDDDSEDDGERGGRRGIVGGKFEREGEPEEDVSVRRDKAKEIQAGLETPLYGF